MGYKLCKVWQSMSDDNGGMRMNPGNFFWTYDSAKEEGSGYGGHPEPEQRDVLITDDGKIFLLSNEITVFIDNAAVIKQRALEKLTPSERKALGF